MKTMTKLTTTLFAAFLGFAATVSAQDAPPAAAPKLPPASTKTGVTYDTDIKPIFVASCTRCHGDQRPGGGIVLTSLESTLKGGKDGKILVVGDSTKGSLVSAVAHLGNDRQSFMPRGRGAKALTPEQVGLIRAWIDQGAK
jgi:mono/diheme cytochrome c family protein